MNVWIINYHDGFSKMNYVTGVADSKETAQVLAQRHCDAVMHLPCTLLWTANGQVGQVMYVDHPETVHGSLYGLEKFEVSTE